MDNIDYRQLPPGRKRALLYSLLVRNRLRLYNSHPEYTHRAQHRTRRLINISPINVNIRTSTNIVRQRHMLNTPYIFRTVNTTTFDFNTEFEDVKIGLINSNLLNLSKVSINMMTENMCVVCQEEIQLNDVIRTISCSHIFHIDCIDKWFSENKKCPMCKFVLE